MKGLTAQERERLAESVATHGRGYFKLRDPRDGTMCAVGHVAYALDEDLTVAFDVVGERITGVPSIGPENVLPDTLKSIENNKACVELTDWNDTQSSHLSDEVFVKEIIERVGIAEDDE